jgi:hypothetical protein
MSEHDDDKLLAILQDGEEIVRGGGVSVRVVYNNLTGKNFEDKPDEHEKYLLFMSSPYGCNVQIRPDALELVTLQETGGGNLWLEMPKQTNAARQAAEARREELREFFRKKNPGVGAEFTNRWADEAFTEELKASMKETLSA